MFDKKEMIFLVIASITLGYLLAFTNTANFSITWLSMAGLALIILFFHHLGQKLTALFYDCSTETQLWTVKQFGFSKSSKFPFPFPAWLSFPIILMLITFGKLKWFAVTIFDAAPLASRVQRRFADLTEWHLALIAFGGMAFNLLIAMVSQLLGYNDFAMLNMYFILFNLIPFSTLDGSKIFFGSPFLWVFATVFSVIVILLLGSTSLLTTLIAAGLIGIGIVTYYYVTLNS